MTGGIGYRGSTLVRGVACGADTVLFGTMVDSGVRGEGIWDWIVPWYGCGVEKDPALI